MIPLSTPNIFGNEKKYILDCLESGWISTSGSYIKDFENKVSEYVGSKFAVGCTNGTSAIQIALKLLDVKNDDEVIVPSLTFIAPVNAIMYNNARPIFMDSDKYYNLDIEKTIDFIKNHTFFKDGHTYNLVTKKRIPVLMPVHVWGNAVWLDDLYEICKERNIKILEDASESLGTRYKEGKFKGHHTGTVGSIGVISFNANKIITSGGGGMIITNSQEFAEKANYLTTQAKDDPIRYIHNEVGYNYRLTNIHAAFGLAQLENINEVLISKKNTHNLYLKKINLINGLSIVPAPKHSDSNYWLNILKINPEIYKLSRDELMSLLEKNGIQTRPVWYLNHLQKKFMAFQSFEIDQAILLLKNSLCIPSSSHLKSKDLEKVIEVLDV